MEAESEFNLILATSRELGELFSEGIIFIGGVATYLHTQSRGQEAFLETSHDSDFLISLTDFADLRDIEEVTANRRLNKHQLIKNQIEFDIYVENQHQLAVSYQEVARHRVWINEIPCACLEHLLVLKIDAGINRYGSAKGDKDQRDIIRILGLMTPPQREIIQPFLSDRRIEYLKMVIARPTPFQQMSRQNAQIASRLRGVVQQNFQALFATEE